MGEEEEEGRERGWENRLKKVEGKIVYSFNTQVSISSKTFKGKFHELVPSGGPSFYTTHTPIIIHKRDWKLQQIANKSQFPTFAQLQY